MARSRIAIFEGYGRPFGAQRPLGDPFGRRGYYVPRAKYVSSDDRGGYGPGRKPRKGYRVKRMKDTPGMKRAQKRFAKCSRKCSGKKSRTFAKCMRSCVKSRRSKR